MNASRRAVIGNFLLFQTLWFAAVMGGARGLHWPALLALAALLLWNLGHGAAGWREARMLLGGLAVALVLEPLWLASGVIQYVGQWHPLLPPLWILALWCGFALTFNHSLAWLQGRLRLAALLGAVGSAGSVIAGVRFAAADAPQGLIVLAVTYGALWALAVPLLTMWAACGRTSERGKPAPRQRAVRQGVEAYKELRQPQRETGLSREQVNER